MKTVRKAAAVLLTAVLLLTGCSVKSSPKTNEFAGQGFNLSCTDDKWLDANEMRKELGSDGTDSIALILESASHRGSYVIIHETNVGCEGVINAGTVGAVMKTYSRTSGSDMEMQKCRELTVDGYNAVAAESTYDGRSRSEMVYVWNGNIQTMITLIASDKSFDEVYPDFEELLESVDLN